MDPARADAEDFFTRAIALEPASGDARIGRYLACAARGIEARAAADFRISFGVTHADSLSDPRPPREKLATTMTLVGQGTRAIECPTEWLDLDPSAAAELLPRRAFLYDRRGRRDDVGDDHDRAESDVRTALALKPNDATFQYWAGVLFRDRAEKLAAFARCIRARARQRAGERGAFLGAAVFFVLTAALFFMAVTGRLPAALAMVIAIWPLALAWESQAPAHAQSRKSNPRTTDEPPRSA